MGHGAHTSQGGPLPRAGARSAREHGSGGGKKNPMGRKKESEAGWLRRRLRRPRLVAEHYHPRAAPLGGARSALSPAPRSGRTHLSLPLASCSGLCPSWESHGGLTAATAPTGMRVIDCSIDRDSYRGCRVACQPVQQSAAPAAGAPPAGARHPMAPPAAKPMLRPHARGAKAVRPTKRTRAPPFRQSNLGGLPVYFVRETYVCVWDRLHSSAGDRRVGRQRCGRPRLTRVTLTRVKGVARRQPGTPAARALAACAVPLHGSLST